MDKYNDQEPVNQAIDIQRNRIMKVVDSMIDKTQIAICLDKILLTETELCEQVSGYNEIKSVLRKSRYFSKRFRKSHSSLFFGDGFSSTKISPSIQSIRLVDMRTNFIMDLVSKLHKSPEIMKKVEALEETNKAFIDLRQKLNNLRDYLQEMVSQSASEERYYFKQVSKAWIFNERYKRHHKELKKIFDEKEMDLNEKVKEKNDLKENYNINMQNMMEKNAEDIRDIIRRSEHNMKQIYTASEEVQKLLSEDVKHVTLEYHTKLETNLINERNLRKNRNKVETVLFNLLAKYDNEIGNLQKQLEIEQEEYNKQKESYDQLMNKFKIQTVQYDELMKEKKEEEERIWNEKYYKFLVQRSCRIIQRWWRRIYWKRHKKKKGKGKKGKKK